MASEPIRDPKKDHLLTPQNSALIIIDYQPVQINSIASMDRQLLVNNIVGVAKAGVTYGLPIIHSTVNVKTGLNKPPIPQLRKVLDKLPTYDRTTINSWEDVEFRNAVKETGRKKLIMTALWTEACLTFHSLDVLKEGYEVYVVAEACRQRSEPFPIAGNEDQIMSATCQPIGIDGAYARRCARYKSCTFRICIHACLPPSSISAVI